MSRVIDRFVEQFNWGDEDFIKFAFLGLVVTLIVWSMSGCAGSRRHAQDDLVACVVRANRAEFKNEYERRFLVEGCVTVYETQRLRESASDGHR